MIYPSSFEEKIGFDKVRTYIKSNCITTGGKLLSENMFFEKDYDSIVQKLAKTDEVMQAIQFHGPFPLSDFTECIDEIIRISNEGTIIELTRIKDFLSTFNTYSNCIKYFKLKKDICPLINAEDRCDNESINEIIKHIKSIVDVDGNIKDNASETLMTIRLQIEQERSRADNATGVILQKLKREGLIKEDTITVIRNGRCVVPVPASNKKAVKGFVHDTSATGQTVYIEPTEVFDINSNISALIIEEKQEIYKIVKTLTEHVREDIPNLVNMCNYLSRIDFIRSKALFAIKIKASKPSVSNIPFVRWYKAIHPLLYLSLLKQNKEVVPLNINLNDEKNILIISGPNAGGKSIALKTLALIQYMVQTGNLVPLSASSEVGIFHDIFIDIGDEQSIENDLSTYTSHLKNMKFFIEKASPSTLILIDEIGSGTEPLLGSAIAEVTLKKLCENNVKGVVTTHYGSIKKLATEVKGIFNGAMMFDTENIAPTYKLQIGYPGSSYTFEIAGKVGFPEILLEQAKNMKVAEQIKYEKLLTETLLERNKLDKQKEEMTIADNFLKEIIEKYQNQLKQIQADKKEIIQNAKIEAAKIIQNANQKVENTISEIKKANAEKEKTKAIRERLEHEKHKAIEEAKIELKELEKKNIKIPKKVRTKLESKMKEKDENLLNKDNNKTKRIIEKGRSFEKLRNDFPVKESSETDKQKNKITVGSYVKYLNSNMPGEVLEVSGKKAKVNFGNMTMNIKLDELFLADVNPSVSINKTTTSVSVNNVVRELNERAYNFNLLIDVRGMTSEEALDAVRDYIDDAIMLKIYNFNILHGKGNGILRKHIRQYLNSLKEVASWKDAALEAGGDGITEVTMIYE